MKRLLKRVLITESRPGGGAGDFAPTPRKTTVSRLASHGGRAEVRTSIRTHALLGGQSFPPCSELVEAAVVRVLLCGHRKLPNVSSVLWGTHPSPASLRFAVSDPSRTADGPSTRRCQDVDGKRKRTEPGSGLPDSAREFAHRHTLSTRIDFDGVGAQRLGPRSVLL